MKKRTLIFTTALVLTSLAVALLGRWYVKISMPKLVAEALNKARANGFVVAFEEEVPPKDALLDLKQIKIENSNLAYQGTIESLKLKTALRAAWPPIKVRLELTKPKITVDPKKRIPSSEISDPKPHLTQTPPFWFAAIPFLTKIEVAAQDLEATPWGLAKADLYLSTERISIDPLGIKQMEIRHQILVKDLSLPRFKKLPGFTVSGMLNYNSPLAYIKDTSIDLGPIQLKAVGKCDLTSQKWNLDIEIPENNFSEIRLPKNGSSISWIKSIEGKIGFRATSQGLGTDLNSINSEGELNAEKIKLSVQHPVINGTVIGTINTKFRKAEDSTLAAYLDLNLDEASIQKDEQFKKSAGIPLRGKFKISGKDQEFQIEQGEFSFNNLKAEITGAFINGPKTTSRLRASVAQTSLTGWEKFFPSLPGIKTTGLFEGGIFYSGTAEDWRAATVELGFKAKNVQIPILKEWITPKNLTVNGITKINSETKLLLSEGQLKTLATDTSIDLKDVTLGYSDLVYKPRGTPMSADLNIKSSSREASFKDSSIKMGPLVAMLKGNITDFSSPIARLKIETNGVATTDIAELIPALKTGLLNVSDGILKSSISIDGPLLSKDKVPGISIESQIKSLSLDYNQKDRPVRIRALNGTLFASKSNAGQTLLKTNSIKFNTLGGSWTVRGSCSGDDKSLRCNPKISLNGVDIEHLMPMLSAKSEGMITGKLKANVNTQFAGLTESEIKKSLAASGSFSLYGAKFKTLKLAQKPVEALNKIPGLSGFLSKTNWDSTIAETRGYFSYKDGSTVLSNVQMNSQNFDLFASSTTIDADQNISSKPLWTPKENLVDRKILNTIRGENGKPTVPLVVQGKSFDPNITVDEAFIQSKLSQYSKFLNPEKAQKLLQDLKKRFGTGLKDAFKTGLSGFVGK